MESFYYSKTWKGMVEIILQTYPEIIERCDTIAQ